jgi:hypothetical protein
LDIDIYVFAYYRRSRYLFVSCLNDLSQWNTWHSVLFTTA